MRNAPRIVVSSLDMQRIENLLAELPASAPGIEALQNELDRADVREPKKMPPDVVTMNSLVEFEMEESAERFELALCYPRDAGKPGTISILAPIGSALLGLAKGQSIEWPVPGGSVQRVRVVDVVYQPERAGDFIH